MSTCLLFFSFAGLVRITSSFPCQSSLHGSYEVFHYITREQLQVLVDTSSARKWIVGPEGSGKTCLIVEKVIQLAEKILLHFSNEKVLVVCYNRPLSVMLRKSFEGALGQTCCKERSLIQLLTSKHLTNFLADHHLV